MKLALTAAALLAASPVAAQECLPVAVTVSDVSVELGEPYGKVLFTVTNDTDTRIEVLEGQIRFFDVLDGRLGAFPLPRFPALDAGQSMTDRAYFGDLDRTEQLLTLPADAWRMETCVVGVYP